MTKLSKDSREVTLLSVSKIITLLLGLITSAILSRVRSLQEYGTYSQMLTVVSITTSALMLGLPNSINFFLSRHDNPEDKKRFVSVYYTVNSILSAITGLMLILAMPLISDYFKNPLIRSFAYFLAVYPWTKIITASMERLLIQYGKSRYVLVFNLCQSCAVLAINVAVAIGAFGFSVYIAMYTVVQSLFAISVYAIAHKLSGGIRILLDRSMIREVLKFSIPLGLASVIGTLNVEMDKLVIGRLMNTEAVALYANAGKELPVTFFTASITAVMLPRITRLIKDGNTEGAVTVWGNAAYVSFGFICLCAFGFITFAPEIITILYSEKYIAGTGIFRIYCVDLLIRFTYIGMLLNATGHTKKILYCSIGTIAFNLVFNVIFYYIFGFIGPAISTVFSALVMNTLQLVMTSRISKIRFSKLFLWKKMFAILLINVALSMVFFHAKMYLPLEQALGGIGEAIFLGVVWCGVYALLVGKRLLHQWKRLGEIEESIAER